MSKLSKQLVVLARQAGGSFKTVSDRMKIAKRLAEGMAILNIQVHDIKNMKTDHIEKYIAKSQRIFQSEHYKMRWRLFGQY